MAEEAGITGRRKLNNVIGEDFPSKVYTILQRMYINFVYVIVT